MFLHFYLFVIRCKWETSYEHVYDKAYTYQFRYHIGKKVIYLRLGIGQKNSESFAQKIQKNIAGELYKKLQIMQLSK